VTTVIGFEVNSPERLGVLGKEEEPYGPADFHGPYCILDHYRDQHLTSGVSLQAYLHQISLVALKAIAK
jgi:hypothetical protein